MGELLEKEAALKALAAAGILVSPAVAAAATPGQLAQLLTTSRQRAAGPSKGLRLVVTELPQPPAAGALEQPQCRFRHGFEYGKDSSFSGCSSR